MRRSPHSGRGGGRIVGSSPTMTRDPLERIDISSACCPGASSVASFPSTESQGSQSCKYETFFHIDISRGHNSSDPLKRSRLAIFFAIIFSAFPTSAPCGEPAHLCNTVLPPLMPCKMFVPSTVVSMDKSGKKHSIFGGLKLARVVEW